LAVGIVVIFGLASQDASEGLKEAVNKLAEAGSYSFKGKQEGGFGGANVFIQGFGRGNEEDSSGRIEGRYQKDAGMMCSIDEMEYVKVGKKTIARPSPRWKTVEEGDENAPADRQLRGFAGQARQFRMAIPGLSGGLMGPRAPRVPHEEIAAWRFKEVFRAGNERVGDESCEVIKAEFGEDEAKKFFGWGNFLGGRGDIGAAGGVKFFVGGDGCQRRLEMEIKQSANFGGGNFDTTIKRVLEFSDVGKTVVEIPEDAKKALE
jgi:hypothetical protein